jgi:hypothetical protein
MPLSGFAAPAIAQAFDEADLGATNAALAGVWRGTETLWIHPEATIENEMEVTFAITGDDGLSYAFWTREYLIDVDYLGDGFYVRRFVGDAAPGVGPQTGRWTEVVAPDAAGDWSRVEHTDGPPYPGCTCRKRYSFEMSDGVLRFLAEAESSGADAGFEPYWEMTLTRTE